MVASEYIWPKQCIWIQLFDVWIPYSESNCANHRDIRTPLNQIYLSEPKEVLKPSVRTHLSESIYPEPNISVLIC